MVNPALSIYGLGGIGLPLSKRDAESIAKYNSAAPYSDTKMANTVVDLTVSKITELSPYQVEMTNPAWEKAVEGVISKVVKKLKVPGGVANVGFMPCNLTLCGPGDMVKKHQEWVYPQIIKPSFPFIFAKILYSPDRKGNQACLAP